MALIGNIVVRRPGEPEVYAETADLHERYSPGNPDWGHPPLEDEVRATDEGWGLVEDPGALFGPTVVRWYPIVQWTDGAGFADLLRTTSLCRRLEPEVREPLLRLSQRGSEMRWASGCPAATWGFSGAARAPTDLAGYVSRS